MRVRASSPRLKYSLQERCVRHLPHQWILLTYNQKGLPKHQCFRLLGNIIFLMFFVWLCAKTVGTPKGASPKTVSNTNWNLNKICAFWVQKIRPPYIKKNTWSIYWPQSLFNLMCLTLNICFWFWIFFASPDNPIRILMKLHENIFYTKCDSFYKIENLIADAGSKSATCMIEPHVQLDIMVKKIDMCNRVWRAGE